MKAVCVIWEDTVGVSTDWTAIKKLRKGKTALIASYGLLLEKTKEKVVILPHYAPGKGAVGCGEMRIPISAVRKIHKLKKA